MEFRNLLNFVLSLSIIGSLLAFVPFAYSVFVTFSVALVGVNIASWLMASTRKYFLYERVCLKNKAVLITGCDSGFGNALARRIDDLGYTVYAACLDPQGDGARTLLNNCSEKLNVLRMDVTDDQSIREAKEFIEKNLGQNVLWAVVNNAGIAYISEVDWTSVEEIQQVYNVNAAGTLRVSKIFLPFIKKSKGRIVNTTSLAGRLCLPGFVGYSMSKSAAVSLTTGLRIELAKWGVKVISIEPFFYSTPLTEIQAIWASTEKTWKTAPEDIKDEYGEDYKESFKKRTAHCLRSYNNPKYFEVVDCLEDAITAKEPLSSYFPCAFLFKAGLMLVLSLPIGIADLVGKFNIEVGRTKPAALMSRKKEK